ncbi:ERI1 exoribonuclease 3 [Tieghemiomyces parasiticus]|uniref:ERI1 exoribonuclease 3 n=1 Tax=Tieghemiomyces parasiticus TaxID=78921 RepID=A0A9W8AK32_9FUNG|nr:ERI1 exoribonuclease 3 [Tieghemiomyces parasiticus]
MSVLDDNLLEELTSSLGGLRLQLPERGPARSPLGTAPISPFAVGCIGDGKPGWPATPPRSRTTSDNGRYAGYCGSSPPVGDCSLPLIQPRTTAPLPSPLAIRHDFRGYFGASRSGPHFPTTPLSPPTSAGVYALPSPGVFAASPFSSGLPPSPYHPDSWAAGPKPRSRCPPAAAPLAARESVHHPVSFPYLVIVDFEATFDPPVTVAPAPGQMPRRAADQEIIEFPLVVFDTQLNKVVDEFHAYVRPVRRPQLTRACTESTGIDQSTIDTAATFPAVFERALGFLAEYEARARATGGALAYVTCGDWDLRKMLPQQCRLAGLAVPPGFRRWINVKRAFADHRLMEQCPMRDMLRHLGLPFIGKRHSGIDDARNVASVLKRLIETGYQPVLTTDPKSP